MRPSLKRIATGLLAAYLAATVAVVWFTYRQSLQGDLSRLAEAGAIRVEQAAERLVNQLTSYQILTNTIADDPRIVAALGRPALTDGVADLLRAYVLTFGAERVELLDRSGAVLASSDAGAGQISRAGSPLVSAALNGRLGRDHGLEAGQRQFRISRGVVPEAPPAQGAVIVTVAVDALEFEWAVVPEAIAFFDREQVAFVSNRQSLLLRQIAGGRGAETGDTVEGRFDPFPSYRTVDIDGFEIWRFADPPDLPAEAMVVRRRVPHLGMTALGFLDISAARQTAQREAGLAATIMTVISLIAVVIALWRRRLADRLALETALNARLESRVEERTAELRRTQNQLIQASKMTALGQMSAGISHELNQPLAAILNFAENAARFIDSGRPDSARRNFQQIAEQVRRVDRIIRHLRGFARNESEPMEKVDLVAVLQEALGLVDASLRKAGIEVETVLPADPVHVQGGKVRLQQVIVNLLNNAMDAMADTGRPRLRIRLEVAGSEVRLTVQDSGPGIEDPSRVFDPFYTTKELGASKGLGLGLSISYGIVGSFGGEITADNAPDGGGRFVVSLPLANPERTE